MKMFKKNKFVSSQDMLTIILPLFFVYLIAFVIKFPIKFRALVALPINVPPTFVPAKVLIFTIDEEVIE